MNPITPKWVQLAFVWVHKRSFWEHGAEPQTARALKIFRQSERDVLPQNCYPQTCNSHYACLSVPTPLCSVKQFYPHGLFIDKWQSYADSGMKTSQNIASRSRGGSSSKRQARWLFITARRVADGLTCSYIVIRCVALASRRAAISASIDHCTLL